jgi:hypothetical protein
MSVWADGAWMLDRDDEGGGGRWHRPMPPDDLVAVLAEEPTGLSCRELAVRLRRRRPTLAATLRADRRFEQSGRGRASRWRLRGTNQEPQRLAETPWDDLDASGVPALGREA